MRKNGASAGRFDIYYISPGGNKIRSKPELIEFIGPAMDLSNFNFRIGHFMENLNGRPSSNKVNRSVILL